MIFYLIKFIYQMNVKNLKNYICVEWLNKNNKWRFVS